MAENTEALTAIQEDIQDQAGMVTRQIQSEVQQLQDEEIHFFSESLQKETGHYEEKEISLAPREFEVLYLLAQRPNWVIPKKNIYCSVWGSNYYDDQIPYKTVEHVVWKIRKKMGHDIIETLINVGYRLKKM